MIQKFIIIFDIFYSYVYVSLISLPAHSSSSNDWQGEDWNWSNDQSSSRPKSQSKSKDPQSPKSSKSQGSSPTSPEGKKKSSKEGEKLLIDFGSNGDDTTKKSDWETNWEDNSWDVETGKTSSKGYQRIGSKHD